MRIMHGVGGDPDARYPRKMAHSEPGDNLSSVVDRWIGSRFDYLDPALRPALTEWTHFDEVDNQLRGHAKRRVEVDFLRNRMEQLHAPFAERTQQGVEVLEYFNMGGHAFACVVAEEMPREPGVYQFVRHFYVEALNAEQAQGLTELLHNPPAGEEEGARERIAEAGYDMEALVGRAELLGEG